MQNHPQNKFVLIVEPCEKTNDEYQNWISKNTAFMAIGFLEVEKALEFARIYQPTECALILTPYKIKSNYTGLDLITQLEELYTHNKNSIPFTSFILTEDYQCLTETLKFKDLQSLGGICTKALFEKIWEFIEVKHYQTQS